MSTKNFLAAVERELDGIEAFGDSLNNSRSICSDYRNVRGADIEKAVLK